MSGFLTDEELVYLTEYKQTEKQAEWLADNRILHFISSKNKVRVTWEAVNHPMYLKSEEPNFENVS